MNICQCGIESCRAFDNPKHCGICKSTNIELVDGHLYCDKCGEGSWHE